jgi:hypothetical protein
MRPDERRRAAPAALPSIRMSVSTALIIGAAAVCIGVGAYKLGHAVDQPARQLDTVVSEPAQAAGATAAANLKAAVSAAALYKIDHGTYAGMTTKGLRGYDIAIASSVSVKRAAGGGYCIESTVAGATVSIIEPTGALVARHC